MFETFSLYIKEAHMLEDLWNSIRLCELLIIVLISFNLQLFTPQGAVKSKCLCYTENPVSIFTNQSEWNCVNFPVGIFKKTYAPHYVYLSGLALYQNHVWHLRHNMYLYPWEKKWKTEQKRFCSSCTSYVPQSSCSEQWSLLVFCIILIWKTRFSRR